MGHRYFPVTVMRGRIFVRLGYQFQPEEAVDTILTVYGLVGHSKVRTAEEFHEAIHSSLTREGSVTLWIREDLAKIVERT